MVSKMSSNAGAGQTVLEADPVTRAGPDDDLLTAGLGLEGLRNPVLPPGASARAAAVHKNFREVVDIAPGGVFDNLIAGGADGLKVSGRDYAALIRIPGASQPIGVNLLVPGNFNWDRPVMVVAPSPGSRGVPGAIGDIGSWALPRGCALVLTDKGTGGVQILADDTCYGADLEPAPASDTPTVFRLRSTAALGKFRQANPQAIALKHAHSGDNVEALWPEIVLAAAQFGLGILRWREGSGQPPSVLDRIKVIAAGLSNGGGAVLRAAENDKGGVLDGIVAVEPNITPREGHGGKVRFGAGPSASPGRRLVDYATEMNLLLPAALGAPELADMPFAEVTAMAEARQVAWADGLAKAGLVEGGNTAARASDALRRIRALGFGEDSEALLPMMAVMHIWPAVSHTFVSALGRFPVEADPLGACTAFARTDALGLTLEGLADPTPEQKRLFGALSGGLSPGGGAFTIYANRDIHPSLKDALDLRRMAMGEGRNGGRVRWGSEEVLASARGRGKPTIVLHGRCDSLISVQHSSRAYVAAAMASGSNTRQLRYYEHDSGQHFESLLGVPGISQRYNPLLPSFFQALDLMRERVFGGAELPPNQVLRRALPGEIDGSGLAVRGRLSGEILAQPGDNEIVRSGNSLGIPA